jgi:hypothetical protein
MVTLLTGRLMPLSIMNISAIIMVMFTMVKDIGVINVIIINNHI